MATHKLNSGDVTLIDDADLHLLDGLKWGIQRIGANHAYAISGKRPRLLLHRVITGAGKGLVVDHINGNGLDNRRANLRVCTFAENLLNRRKSSNGSSKYKGVQKTRGGRWEALIGSQSVNAATPRTRLGTYDTQEEAAAAYDIAAVLRYGQFACLNFPHVFPEVSSRKA